MDRVAELEARVRLLTTELEQQTEGKDRAYEQMTEQSQVMDSLEQKVVELNVHYARECARATGLELEASLYRERYVQTLKRISLVSRTVGIANAACDYMATIELRGSLEGDVVARLEVLREKVGLTFDPTEDPQQAIIGGLEDELEALRRRVAELKDEAVTVAGQVEDLEGTAADWQELAEANDRALVEARKKLKRWEQWPSEVRHVLGHVFHCRDNCDTCRRMVGEILAHDDWSPGSD